MNKKINTIIVLSMTVFILGFIAVGSSKRSSDTEIPEVISREVSPTIETPVEVAPVEKVPNDMPEETTPQPPQTSPNILYWGTTCPYCHEVIGWIEENEADKKITIIRKEVYENRANSLELTQKARDCGLDTRSIGVPFMYTSTGECLIGYPDIVGYLEKGIK